MEDLYKETNLQLINRRFWGKTSVKERNLSNWAFDMSEQYEDVIFKRDVRTATFEELREDITRKRYTLGVKIPPDVVHIETCYFCDESRVLQKHHIIHRKDGGLNNPENIMLLCPTHHYLIHHGKHKLFKVGSSKKWELIEE